MDGASARTSSAVTASSWARTSSRQVAGLAEKNSTSCLRAIERDFAGASWLATTLTT